MVRFVHHMTEVRVILDHRERGLQRNADLMAAVDACENLDLGDLCIYMDGEPVLLVERKSLPDLAASLKDGRYREQKGRMLSSVGGAKMLYILEGDMTYESAPGELLEHVCKEALIGCVINTTVRDGLRVLRTKDTTDTAALLLGVITRVRRDPIKYFKSQVGGEVCIVTRKKDSITPSMCFEMQLSQIPGVSAKTAVAVRGAFQSMKDLCSRGTVAGIAEVKLPSGRRVGATVGQRILDFLGAQSELLSPTPADACI